MSQTEESSPIRDANNPQPPSPRSLFERLKGVGNHDFCPWANRYVYWLKQPVGWLVAGAAASVLTAIYLEPQLWSVFGALVAVMVLGCVWPWLAQRGTSAEIHFRRHRSREGDRVEAILVVHNRWPWSLWGLAVEKGFFLETPDESLSRPVAALARVPGWSRSEFTFEFHPEGRGVYPRESPVLTNGFPFGLWHASRLIDIPRELIVWPRTTPLTSIPSLSGDIADVIGMPHDRPGNDGEVIGVRPFRQGDRLRNIHWAQTARRDAMIVTERQAAARRTVSIVIDVAALIDGDRSAGSENRELETAIRVGASVAQELHAHHADVRFVIGDIDLWLRQGPRDWPRLLDALARFEIPEDTPRLTRLSDAHSFTILLTTPKQNYDWERQSTRNNQLRLVLLGGAISPPPESNRRRHAAWMTIDCTLDHSRQLRHQWEGVCHDSIAN